MHNRWWSPRDDDGFTLVEVIVALSLLAIVASGALVFFVRGTSGAAAMQRKQTAVALANQATDLARSLKPADLVKGRSTTAATTAWNASQAPDKAQSYPASEGLTVAASQPALAFDAVQRVSNQTYHVKTLVGTCYRKLDQSASTACGLAPGYASTAPTAVQAAALSAYVRMYRVMVEVAWDAGGQASGCTAGKCTYYVSTLVDPTDDQLWNVKAKPIPSSTPRNVPAQANEAGYSVDLKPISLASNVDANTEVRVTDTSGLTRGQLKIDDNDYNKDTNYRGKTLKYVPQQNDLGVYTLKYYLINSDGQSSSVVTMTIRVIPVAVNDSPVSVKKTKPVSVNFGTNDKPNNYGGAVAMASFTMVSGACTNQTPANGIVAITAGSSAGSCVYSYSIKAVSNAALVSDEGSFTVTVTN